MTFDAREHATQIADQNPPFEWTGMDGGTYYLPHPMTLEAGIARKLNDANRVGDEETVFELLELLVPDSIDAILALPVGALEKLMGAWYATMGDSGKSPGPRSAPNRAARRSKQTSPSAAKTSGGSRSTKSRAASKP